MAKTRSRRHNKSRRSSKNKPSFMKNISKTTNKAIPYVKKGLKDVGSATMSVSKKATPVIEKGLGVVYGTLASGFDLGVKCLKKSINFVSTRTKSKTTRKSKKNRSKKY